MLWRGILCLALALALGAGPLLRAQTAANPDPKKPPAVLEIMKSTPEEFLKRHDLNRDGYLSKDEVPPLLAGRFEAIDRNGDGKLDVEELTQAFQVIRARFAAAKEQPADAATVEKIIAKIMMLDANKDGKISREEARGSRIGEAFDRLDTNRDGFLDREEVRRLAQNFAGAQPGGNPGAAGPGAAPPDFDALDQNADGRLTREELRGTAYSGQFDQIDANRDGRIDRREFESFFRKNREKKD